MRKNVSLSSLEKKLLVNMARGFLSHLLCFHAPFWLCHILVYLFYFCPSFCVMAKTKKGDGKAVIVLHGKVVIADGYAG